MRDSQGNELVSGETDLGRPFVQPGKTTMGSGLADCRATDDDRFLKDVMRMPAQNQIEFRISRRELAVLSKTDVHERDKSLDIRP